MVWGYPVKIRLDMLTTGIRTPVGIKITGSDLSTIDKIAKEVEILVRGVAGINGILRAIPGDVLLDLCFDGWREVIRAWCWYGVSDSFSNR